MEQENTATLASEEDNSAVVENTDNVEKVSRQVPLEALEAERRKRQDAETQARIYQELIRKNEDSSKQASVEDTSDDEELISRKDLKNFHQRLSKEELMVLKRDIAEETFKDTQPQAIKLINTHLKEILERKPWLADSIQNAPNRYARAYEIVGDYMPQVVAKQTQATSAKKIVENSQKPGSPIGVGKTQSLSGQDYMKSIAGTKEFNEYRKKLLGR